MTLLLSPKTCSIVSRVKTLSRDLRGHQILGQDRREARGLTLGSGDDLIAIGASVGDDASRLAAGLRKDLVGIGLGLILQPLLVLACLDGIVERALTSPAASPAAC
jgi:hypothetical protein